MKKRTMQYHIDALMALLLFGIFAICVLLVLLTGSRAYGGLTQRDQASYEYRTRTQYIAARVRQADCVDGIAVENFRGATALVLAEEEGYVTRIYCYDGYLMELYAAADARFALKDGEKLVKASDLELSLENGLLQVVITGPEGNRDTMCLALRSGEGAGS